MSATSDLVNTLGRSDSISGVPTMTYMKENYLKKTRYTNQLVTLQFPKTEYYGSEFTLDLYKEGDLIDGAWLQLAFPTLSNVSSNATIVPGPTGTIQGGGQTVNSMAWSPTLGIFVCVTDDSSVINCQGYSTDGTSWTFPVTQVAGSWSSVVWSTTPALFCAISPGSYAITSTTGTSWNLGNSGQIIQYNKALTANSAGLFVSVGYAPTSTTLFSTGTNAAASITTPWTSVTFPFAINPQNYGVVNGLTVTAGTQFTGKTLVVTGTTASTITCSISPAFIANQTVNSGNVVTVATNSGFITAYTSTNGSVWAKATQYGQSTPTFAVAALAYSPTLNTFVGVGTNSQIYDTGAGNAWTAVASPVSGTWTSVTWASDLGIFLAVGTNAVMTSVNGITWTSVSAPPTGAWLTVARGGGVFMATGNNNPNTAAYSYDGINWVVFNIQSDTTSNFGTTAQQAYYGLAYSPTLSLFSIGGTFNYTMTMNGNFTYVTIQKGYSYTPNVVSNSFGTYMLNWVQLEQGKQIIERLHGEYIEMFNDFTVPQGKQSDLSNLVGKGLTSNLAVYYVKLPFSAFKYGFPICALDENPRIRFNIRNFNEGVYGLATNITPIFSATLAVDYLFLEEPERQWFMNNPLTYVVGQNQYFSTQFNVPVSQISQKPFSLPLVSMGTSNVMSFNLPNFTNIVNSVQLAFNFTTSTSTAPTLTFVINGVAVTFAQTKLTNSATATATVSSNIYTTSNNTVSYYWPGVTVTAATLAVSGTVTSGGSAAYSIRPSFYGPCKELFFVLQNSSAVPYDYTLDGTNYILSSMRIVLNNTEFLKSEVATPMFLRTLMGLDCHVRIPDRKFYFYPFSMDPENDQPTGALNFSTLSSQQFDFYLNSSGSPINLRMYMRAYNAMKIEGGQLSMQFYGPTDVEGVSVFQLPPSKFIATVVSGSTKTTTYSGYTALQFTSSGVLNVTSGGIVYILLVGGGGGSGGTAGDSSGQLTNGTTSGAGGGGGVLYITSYALSPGTYNVSVGAGGVGGSTLAYSSGAGSPVPLTPTPYPFLQGSNGGNSTFGPFTAYGGGGGGSPFFYLYPSPPSSLGLPGLSGGSGGGGVGTPGGSGVPGQGFAGSSTGNGGGAGGPGTLYSYMGGPGIANGITGTTNYYGAGGGAAALTSSSIGGFPNGGNGSSGPYFYIAGTNGAANTGAGAGGQINNINQNFGTGYAQAGITGSSGTVIIRYRT